MFVIPHIKWACLPSTSSIPSKFSPTWHLKNLLKFLQVAALMCAEAKPISYIKQQEYENRIANAYESERSARSKRISENEEYARNMTAKLVDEFKTYKLEEENKLADKSVFYVPAEPNFFVAVLIRSKVDIAPKPKKVLELLRLNRINNAVILKNNKSIKKMLQIAKDYVAYGFVSYELLRKMIYLRGFGRIGSSRVKLTNETIDEAFSGKYRCVEELVNVIYFGKTDMKEVCKFINPMPLNCPFGGFKGSKNKDYLLGGAKNNHRELLGELVSRML